MKRDELNKINVNNTDGDLKVEENSLKNIKEVNRVPEVEKSSDEVFQASEENKIEEEGKQSFDNADSSKGDSTSSPSSAGATSAGATAGIVGGVVAVVAVSAVLVLGIVKLPVIPAVDVHLIAASSSSLAFSLNTNIENHSELTISLSGTDYSVSTSFQEYVKFSNLRQNEVYTLAVYEGETSRYSSNFYTNEKEDINNITITVTSYIDDKLYFYFEDSIAGEKLYTVSVKNKAGTVIFMNETTAPREYEIENFKEDVAIFISVNGVLTAGMQVFKPVYDYDNIEWIWGEYGATITAIIPSLNETDDYYVRDIRNFIIEEEAATCTSDGYVIRSAAFIGPNKVRYESEKTFVIPALGHDFSDVTYTWSNNYHSCKAESTCAHCDVKIEESVTVEPVQVTTDAGVSFTRYTATFENENFSVRNHYEDLTYGKYPQTIVNDIAITGPLNQEYGTPITQSDKWTSYNYYASGATSSFMQYVDVDSDNDGELDYRGVYFSDYRPINTTDAIGSSSYQYDNGYQTSTTYWFSYEPIEWSVLDQDDGKLFITSKIILDSQSYYHEVSESEFAHNGGSGYANNYALSDIRAWLNNEFYSLAFNDASAVETTTVDNSLSSTLDASNPYTCDDTNDKMFLLSRSENHDYLSGSASTAEGSDYAKCQGLYVAQGNSKGFWGLRTPYPELAYQTRYINNNGGESYDSVNKSSQGVRPSCWININ